MEKGSEMKTKIFTISAAVILFFSGMLDAENIVIDFEILGAGGDDGPTYIGSSSYCEDGFMLSTDTQFGFLRLSSTDSIALFSQSLTATLTKEDGETFDLISMDFFPYFLSSDSIEFSAILYNNTMVYDTFPPYAGDFTTLLFSNFSDVISVSWKHYGGNYTLFDNITIIPEPTTSILFGLSMIILIRKRNIFDQ